MEAWNPGFGVDSRGVKIICKVSRSRENKLGGWVERFLVQTGHIPDRLAAGNAGVLLLMFFMVCGPATRCYFTAYAFQFRLCAGGGLLSAKSGGKSSWFPRHQKRELGHPAREAFGRLPEKFAVRAEASQTQ